MPDNLKMLFKLVPEVSRNMEVLVERKVSLSH